MENKKNIYMNSGLTFSGINAIELTLILIVLD